MFKTAFGVNIPFPEKITEEYQIIERGLKCNISFEKLELFIKEFIIGLDEPLGFALHLPLNSQEEEKIRKSPKDPLHEAVYYLYECSKDQIISIFNDYGDILLNDGISKFAVASHVSLDEIFIEKYKIVYILSKTPDNYIPLLHQYGLERTTSLLTVWDTFSHKTPGRASRVIINNLDIYDVVNELKNQGMYRKEIIELNKKGPGTPSLP